MIDQHVSHYFPDFAALGLEEEMEGDLYYSGDISIEQMISTLEFLGFTVERFDGTDY